MTGRPTRRLVPGLPLMPEAPSVELDPSYLEAEPQRTHAATRGRLSGNPVQRYPGLLYWLRRVPDSQWSAAVMDAQAALYEWSCSPWYRVVPLTPLAELGNYPARSVDIAGSNHPLADAHNGFLPRGWLAALPPWRYTTAMKRALADFRRELTGELGDVDLTWEHKLAWVTGSRPPHTPVHGRLHPSTLVSLAVPGRVVYLRANGQLYIPEQPVEA